MAAAHNVTVRIDPILLSQIDRAVRDRADAYGDPTEGRSRMLRALIRRGLIALAQDHREGRATDATAE